jgi:hypothetical protein
VIILIGGLIVGGITVAYLAGVLPPNFTKVAPGLALFGGLGGTVLAVEDMSQVKQRIAGIDSPLVVANVGAGLWLAVIGSIAVVASMIWVLSHREKSAPPPTPRAAPDTQD